ncbi:hypothetical protein V8E36_009272 [Tilletia maclaganii]
MTSVEKKANFKTPSRRDSLRRKQALQSDAWSQLTSTDDVPEIMAQDQIKQSPIVSQEAYIPLPTQPSGSSIHSGFTPGGPIPNNFSYLGRSNSLATSTRPNRPKGLAQSNSATSTRSPQLPYSPSLPSASLPPTPSEQSIQHAKADPYHSEAEALSTSASTKQQQQHPASTSLDMDKALKRTMHARPPSVEDIFAELDAAEEAKKHTITKSRTSSPTKGHVSRRAAEFASTLPASDSEPAFSTMRRMPVPRASYRPQAEFEVVPPATEPRQPGAIMPFESPLADRAIPRRSKTLSSFPPHAAAEQMSFHEQRSAAEKARIAEKVAQLPANPKTWAPSQVAVYLSHALGLIPRPIVEDVTAFVRASRMNGNVFLRLREQDLAEAGVNRKWLKLMLASGEALRRDCVKCQIWGFGGGGDGDGEVDTESQNKEMPAGGEVTRDGENDAAPAIDVAALRAGYLKVAPTAVSSMRGSVRRIKDRHAVQGMIQAFETRRTEADLSESEEDAFVALGSGRRARQASFGAGSSIDSSDDGDYAADDDDDHQSMGSTRSVRERETASIKAIYGDGFVRRRAESYSSLSDVEQGMQAQIESDVQGDRSISRARAEARRKRAAASQADSMLVNAWIESLTDEEAQTLANELEAKEILDRGLLKPLIETAGLHTKDVSDTSVGSSSTGSVRDDLKLLLGSVNTATLAQHDLLAVVPALAAGGDAEDLLLSESAETSPTVERRELVEPPAHAAAVPKEDGAARVAQFTPVSQEVLMAIFDDAEEAAELAARNAAINQRVDQFLDIKKQDGLGASSAVVGVPESLVHQQQQLSSRSSRYYGAAADTDADRFDTTRRSKQISSHVSELLSLFPAQQEQQQEPAEAAEANDVVHATVKPPAANASSQRAQNLSSTSYGADDEYEISPNGSIRRRVGSEAVVAAAAAAFEEQDEDEFRHATVVFAPSAGAGAGAHASYSSPPSGSESAATRPVETQPASIRDIFGPLASSAAPLQPVVEAAEVKPAEALAVDDAELDVALPGLSAADGSEAEMEHKGVEAEAIVVTEAQHAQVDIADVAAAEPESEAPQVEERPSTVEAVDVEPPAYEAEQERLVEDTPKLSSALEAVPEEEDAKPVVSEEAEDAAAPASETPTADEPESAVPSLTASKLPTPNLHAKKDPSVDMADISGLDLDIVDDVDVSELDPIEPGAEKVAVPLTTLAPAPDGKGSIKKRSMVLVDRRRFESLARRLGVLEEQLAGLESDTSSAVGGNSHSRASNLRNMFSSEHSDDAIQQRQHSSVASSHHSISRAVTATDSMRKNSKLLAQLGRDLDASGFDDELIDDGDDDDRWALGFSASPQLRFGAIPSYLLGLGAGIGFVLVSEVIQRATRLTR